jgi:hypothetical protein
MRPLSGQNGQVLIVIIIGVLLIGTLASGMFVLTSTGTLGEITANPNDQAYQLAKAGIRYAANPPTSFSNQNFYLLDVNGNVDTNHYFNVNISGSTITSEGIVNPNTSGEARRVLTYTLPSWAGSPGSPISFQNNMASFANPIVNATPAIVVNSNQTITLGNSGSQNVFGSLWYQGSAALGSCQAGACNFGSAMRVYFQFVMQQRPINQTASADGFTFAVISALTNTRDRTGGAPPGVSSGSDMGYAGPGNTSANYTGLDPAATLDGLGLRPPKMAVEFDIYQNDCNCNGGQCGNAKYCSYYCDGNKKCDPDTGPNNESSPTHAAIVFWGSSTDTYTCSSQNVCPGNINNANAVGTWPEVTCDDNVHGAGGSGTDPQNPPAPTSGAGGAGFYMGPTEPCLTTSNGTCNWLEDGYTYTCRIEITRSTLGSGNGQYVFNIWILRLDQSPQASGFSNVTVPYTGSTPQISYTLSSLASTWHNNLSSIYFGFTGASGQVTQSTTISNLQVFFAP